MRIYCLAALLWCAPASAVSIAEKLPLNPAGWNLYPEDLLRSVTSYLASTLKFSGDSTHTNDAASGRLNVSGNNMILSSHDISLDFRDSVSRRGSGDAQSLAIRYAFPVAGVNFAITLEDSEYVGVTTKTGQQVDTRGEFQGVNLSGSRALWSLNGFEVNSVFNHSSGTNHKYEESVWISDTSHQLSSFGLRCSGRKDLVGGVQADTTVTALGGLEGSESTMSSAVTSERTRFHKLTLGASLSRSFYTWDLGLDGRYQLAPDDLASSEYLQVAGPSMSYGFSGQSMYVAEGGWVRMNARSPGYSLPFFQALNSYVSVSVLRGWAPISAADGENFGASTGEISLRLQGRGFHASMNVGQILDLSGEAMRRPAGPDVSLSMSLGI
ncbi:ShlB/FhaC/HecB family hemolysin secretion/activation protein [Marinobacter sp.]|uniref:ShlB/FhaC/HecB family hemolysin secretion/activation protein n=1 Tax=Marinobacter sp. TaxID=50741 RepID=UPI0010FEAADB|nr:ShlB/FhaC/HecB family hemolysin secretion/activation protein [Marinobacter sp.]